MEGFPQTQGGFELWSSFLVLHTGLVSHCLCRPTAPPSAWSVLSVICLHFYFQTFSVLNDGLKS